MYKKFNEEMIKIRRDLHQIPEVGLYLEQTKNYVIQILQQHQINYEIIADAGIVATIGDPNSKKTFLLRGDMDALPMNEESGLPFATTFKNAAHTCGHDIHTTMVLGAAILLKQQEQQLNGYVKILFQPFEEGIVGAKLMIENNVLDNVDAAMAFHVLTTYFPGNTIAGIAGPITAGSDIFRVEIEGKGGHGSTPHQVIDPLKIGIRLYQEMQQFLIDDLSSFHSNVLTVGNFHSGSTHNVIPSEMFFEGTIRYFNEEDHNLLTNRIKALCTTFETLYNCKIKYKIINSCPPTVNDKNLLDLFIKSTSFPYIPMEYPFSFSEDFSFISHKIPSIFLVLNSGNEEEGYIYPLHHPKIVFNEDTILTGILAFVETTKAFFAD